MEKYTPMMQQYLKTKEEYKDTILFYRLGDFYEMFFDDALLVSRELELVLTGKNCGVEEKAPMCGVPFHSADGYISRLVEKGYKVAICEQVEDPKQSKGLVRREVVRTVTPGTHIDADTEDACFIACAICLGNEFGLAICDAGTGEFILMQPVGIEHIREILLKYQPREIVGNEAFSIALSAAGDFTNLFKTSVFTLKNVVQERDEAIRLLSGRFEQTYVSEYEKLDFPALCACSSLLAYLYETQKSDLSHINRLNIINDRNFLVLDAFSFRNLELLEPMRRDDKKGCLLYVLDKTQTAMGRRLLKSYIRTPLVEPGPINRRLDAIEELNENPVLCAEIGEYLKGVYDIERLISRISYRSANPRDLLSLKQSISNLGHIKNLLSDSKSLELAEISSDMDALSDIFGLIDKAIDDEAPVSVHDGEIIRAGYNDDCDALKQAATNGKGLLSEMEEKEREATGIKNLRIRYNRVFGYYIEVTNSYLSLVPDYYIRRQTLANGERFFTEQLKSLEDTILGAREKLNRLEYELFTSVIEFIRDNEKRIQESAKLLARLDVYISLSQVAVRNNYVRPGINTNGIIDIRAGRHPVVEMMTYPAPFIENDTYLDNESSQMYLITGPNMAGKSTYMRQCAIIVLMAHMGCFVPAKSADIGIVDRIFTRVGASDDLSSGQSTFMVEMNEMANILKNATKDSLIILDEIGRGTSTYDGLSIAWAVTEHIADREKLGAKTLFATHYHELTQLEDELTSVKNYSCLVSEKDDHIIFLRKVTKGAADKSYGIQVASLAGIPSGVTDRAKEILDQIIKEHEVQSASVPESVPVQLSFFDGSGEGEKIKESIRGFDINNKTPMDAFMFINELKEKYGL